MTRNTARRIAVKIVFSLNFKNDLNDFELSDYLNEERFTDLALDDDVFSEFPDQKQAAYISGLINETITNLDFIDSIINKYSKKWSADRISHTALSILRVAVCELFYIKDIPASVSVNEAVEISKDYDSPETTAYINGVLGSIIRNELVSNE